MKVLIAFCAIALVFCFIGEAKAGDDVEPTIALPEERGCFGLTFSDDGTSATGRVCPEYNCGPGKTRKITEDKTKPYPDCCPHTECVD